MTRLSAFLTSVAHRVRLTVAQHATRQPAQASPKHTRLAPATLEHRTSPHHPLLDSTPPNDTRPRLRPALRSVPSGPEVERRPARRKASAARAAARPHGPERVR
ncbi:hypothetical protein ACQPZF_40120 [Actinosynnema sp. CS-041913]|uniref:hypothetical protein n=1 Tax=Actinosynnema sp. CS-041913 TaxID=3239917 RepID=UPI003D93DFAC